MSATLTDGGGNWRTTPKARTESKRKAQSGFSWAFLVFGMLVPTNIDSGIIGGVTVTVKEESK